ncbi:DEKNAAC101203 [Brettanomyces naardenensis]|uniref:Ribosome biogenesis protein SLX9 n=1 Tax=Brettanomyces naardenensis TaxID=13370 RepID=A0A448YHA7_BRENA|nr:DEKNAAC101203 [Brettanomyces naardenensis]
MAIKKRGTLRAKARKRAGFESSATTKAIASKERLLDKLVKEKVSRAEKVPSLDANQSGISKSSIRRRKRKLREQLSAKLSDLETALIDTTKVQERVEEEHEDEAVSRKKLDHRPNPHSARGAMALAKKEGERFKAVLKETEFRENPFASLKEAILRNNSL